MARKRLAMQLISNKRVRMASFEKRKKGLKKAAYELSTLCGVDINMIIVCNDESYESEVWPPNSDTVARMAAKLYKMGSGQDGRCRTYGVLDYFKEKREEIKKMREKARERKYAKWDDEFVSFSHDQLRELGGFLRAKIGAVREEIKSWVFAPEIEQQQILAYNNTFANMGESRNPYLNTKFSMNPYLQESEIYMPEILQQHQQMACYEAQNNIGYQNEKMMMMMNSDGAELARHNVNE